MRTNKVVLIAVLAAFGIGALSSWYVAKYFDKKVAHAKSSVILIQAHEAAKTHDIQRAVVRAAQATILDPTDYTTHLALAEYCERAGLFALALESYKEARDWAQKVDESSALVRIEKKIGELGSRPPS